jgi:hypothetical protein
MRYAAGKKTKSTTGVMLCIDKSRYNLIYHVHRLFHQ